MTARTGHGHGWLFAFVDVLLVLNFVLASYVFLTIPEINPPTKANPETTKPPGSIAVLVCWPEGPIDVDTWADGPGQKTATGYSARSGAIWSLLRDDLGSSGELTPSNCESMFARATPAGEYVVNVHGFSLPTGPVVVHVEVALGTGGDIVLLVKTDIELRPKQERTVVRFTLDGNGKVVPGSENQVFKALRSAKK